MKRFLRQRPNTEEVDSIAIRSREVFSAAKVYMSVGGRMYSGAPIHSSYIPDVVLEHARNVTVKLHHMVGRFIKLQLYFASRWLMISEVSFDSGKNYRILW
ncbi:unnamed protein product [Nezara viridula]|uniref:Discoidin domain-containing protein n=1 Tax=Nezara viridula TaxID=85310 RepID=A0A9P0EHA9_NEZVI|nr:unnamed protein product [Nezara viridula]